MPHMKKYLRWENQKIHQKFQYLFQPNLILMANTPTPGQYPGTWPFTASLRVTTHRPVAFLAGRLNLYWRNIHAVIYKCRSVCQRMHGQWRLQIICTYRWNSYLKHVRNSSQKNKEKYQVTIEKIMQSNTI